MLDLVSAEEGCHEHEVEDEQGPEDGEVEESEEGQEGAQEVRMDQFLPQDELLDLPLEALELIVVSHWQDVLPVLEILLLWVHQWREIEHDLVEIE